MNYMNLINEYAVLFEMLEQTAGEITPEIDAYMDEIGARTEGALFNLQDIREEASCAIDAIKSRISDLSSKIDRLAKTADRCKALQIEIMDAAGKKTVDNGVYKITRTINPLRVVVEDDTAIPERYLVGEVKMPMVEVNALRQYFPDIVPKISVDKKQIAEVYKAGVEIPGCLYVRDPNVKVS